MRSITARQALAAFVAIAALAVIVPAQGNVYVAGGAAVYRSNGETQVDDGGVVCSLSTGVGIGGGCIPFGPYGAIGVADTLLSPPTEIAFQVCIDNNGDRKCTDVGQEPTGVECADQVYFSHSDKGDFFNPLGPLPPGFAPGCSPIGAFPGYVVFICEGVHTVEGATHVHPATTGSINPSPIGTGFGNFCGANGRGAEPVEKDYALI